VQFPQPTLNINLKFEEEKKAILTENAFCVEEMSHLFNVNGLTKQAFM